MLGGIRLQRILQTLTDSMTTAVAEQVYHTALTLQSVLKLLKEVLAIEADEFRHPCGEPISVIISKLPHGVLHYLHLLMPQSEANCAQSGPLASISVRTSNPTIHQVQHLVHERRRPAGVYSHRPFIGCRQLVPGHDEDAFVPKPPVKFARV